MKVLVACESSGRVAAAFRNRGHNAISCDLEPCEYGPGQAFHYQGDVGPLLSRSWDLIIAHPPCTRLRNSGVRWLAERDLWDDLATAAQFFNMFKGAAPRVCIENPIPHKHARKLIGAYTQVIQPWQFWTGPFGAGESKATCLWLEGLPKLVPTTPSEIGRHQACWLMSPGPERTRARSRTYPGIAKAMAEQWG